MINIIEQSKKIVHDDLLESFSDKLAIGNTTRLQAAANDLIAAYILAVCQKAHHENGAEELARTLEEHYDGELASHPLENMIKDSSDHSGESIARDLFGKQREEVHASVSRMSGLDQDQVDRLSEMISPLVMSLMAKVKSERELDAPGLEKVLTLAVESTEGDRAEVYLLEKILQKNNHSSWVAELTEYSKKLLGSLL